ncbi:MAG: hypothetical protein RSE41_01650 [Clostridia bacterium]
MIIYIQEIYGDIGSTILVKLFNDDNIDISKKHIDCGKLIYDENDKSVFCGGSGAGCISSVFSSYIFKKLKDKEEKKILLVATGALMSTTSIGQGETIPSIAHLVSIEVN